MFRKTGIFSLLFALALVSGCHNNKAPNPIANLDSKQPDKVLFDRAMQAIHNNKFDTARITLQTLINTYPDSEFIARAKLAVGDSWYAEGNTAALQQAEVEYKDFQTFFPNMPEAAEAQMKVAGIHFKQMEKPDRDYTQAKRAEDEYRQMIQQYPDSKLIPEAKERLRQVQEVLADREYRIGRFYFLRASYSAAIARLRSMVDAYPLYSQADDALFMLGQIYQIEAQSVRAGKGTETLRASMSRKIEDQAAAAYGQIITRYPAGGRASDAAAKLKAMNRPIPTPTQEAIAQSKAEEASRGETGRVSRVMGNFKRGPDLAHAASVGEPTLEDPKPTNATDVMRGVVKMAVDSSTEGSKTTVETVGDGKGASNEAVPRSDENPTAPAPAGDAAGAASTKDANASGATGGSTTPAQVNDAKTSGDSSSSSAPPPTQVNDAKSDGASSSATTDGSTKADKKEESTSKPKKKKGLRKLIPF